jgi:hypothetical protein
MIQVFSTGHSGDAAASSLNEQFEEWKKGFGNNNIEIISFQTTSSKWGFMLTIHYKVVSF